MGGNVVVAVAGGLEGAHIAAVRRRAEAGSVGESVGVRGAIAVEEDKTRHLGVERSTVVAGRVVVLRWMSDETCKVGWRLRGERTVSALFRWCCGLLESDHEEIWHSTRLTRVIVPSRRRTSISRHDLCVFSLAHSSYTIAHITHQLQRNRVSFNEKGKGERKGKKSFVRFVYRRESAQSPTLNARCLVSLFVARRQAGRLHSFPKHLLAGGVPRAAEPQPRLPLVHKPETAEHSTGAYIICIKWAG